MPVQRGHAAEGRRPLGASAAAAGGRAPGEVATAAAGEPAGCQEEHIDCTVPDSVEDENAAAVASAAGGERGAKPGASSPGAAAHEDGAPKQDGEGVQEAGAPERSEPSAGADVAGGGGEPDAASEPANPLPGLERRLDTSVRDAAPHVDVADPLQAAALGNRALDSQQQQQGLAPPRQGYAGTPAPEQEIAQAPLPLAARIGSAVFSGGQGVAPLAVPRLTSAQPTVAAGPSDSEVQVWSSYQLFSVTCLGLRPWLCSKGTLWQHVQGCDWYTCRIRVTIINGGITSAARCRVQELEVGGLTQHGTLQRSRMLAPSLPQQTAAELPHTRAVVQHLQQSVLQLREAEGAMSAAVTNLQVSCQCRAH